MSTIPLPALHVNPPPDPSEGIQRMMAMRGMMQQQAGQQQVQQQRAIEIQNAQMQQQDQIKLRGLFVKHAGDLDKVIQDAPQAGVSPQTIQQLQLHNVDVKTKTADLVQKQGANAQVQADLMAGAHDAVDKAPAEQKQAVWTQQLQGLQQRGVDVSQLPPQYPGDEQFQMLGAVVKGHKQLVEDALKGSEQTKNASQGKEADARAAEAGAQTTKLNLENEFIKNNGGMTPGMMESRYISLQSKAKQGLPISPADKAFMGAYEKNKTLVPTANFNLQNAGATGQGGQPSAIAQSIAAGQMKWGDAISPRTPMNVKEALLKEVKSINPNFNSGDFTVEQKVKEAFTSGKPAEELTAFNTAIAHADLLSKASKALDNGDVRGLNTIGNALGVQFGSDKQTNFRIIADAYTREVNKALTSGHVTDSEIKEIGGTIPANASPAQLAGAVQTYRALMQSKVEQRKNQYEAGKKAQPNFGEQPPAATPVKPGGFDWSKFPKVNQ